MDGEPIIADDNVEKISGIVIVAGDTDGPSRIDRVLSRVVDKCIEDDIKQGLVTINTAGLEPSGI